MTYRSDCTCGTLAWTDKTFHPSKLCPRHGDLYTRAVAKVLQIPMEEVTKDQRDRAKQFCFAAVYGQSRNIGNVTTDDPDFDPSKYMRDELERLSKENDDRLFEQVCEILYFMWDKEKR